MARHDDQFYVVFTQCRGIHVRKVNTTITFIFCYKVVTATSVPPRPGCRISAGDDHLSSLSEFGDVSDAESSDISTPSISPFSLDDELSEPEAELDEQVIQHYYVFTRIKLLDLQLSTTPSTAPKETEQIANQDLGYKIVGDNIDKQSRHAICTQEATKTSLCITFTLLLYKAE